MNGYDTPNNDHKPVVWVNGHPIYAAYFIVAVFVVSLITTSILLASNLQQILVAMSFSSTGMLKGEIWRLITYGFVNPPSIQFAVDMLLMAQFGREVEKLFGRNLFLGLCAGLYFLPPLLFVLIGHWWPTYFSGESIALAIFVSFAVIYPNAVLMFNVLAKWAAIILVGIFALIHLAYHDWAGLIALGMRTSFAYVFVCHHQGRLTLPSLNFWARKPKLRLLPDLKPTKTISIKVAKENSMAEMDELLDKIARSGMSSLTAKERTQLAKAREDLMQKKPDRR